MLKDSIRKADIATFLLHWLLAISLFFSFFTGMRIAADAIDADITQALSMLWMQGNVTQWHIIASFVIFFVMIAYPVFIYSTKQSKRWSMAGLKNSKHRSARWRMFNIGLYWVVSAMLGFQLIAGLILYFNSTLISDALIRDCHRVVAWGLLAYVVLHVLAQIKIDGVRQLLRMLMFRFAYTRIAMLVILVSATGTLSIYFFEQQRHQVLRIYPAEAPPVLDGRSDDGIWKNAPQVTINTVRGANLPGGETKVKIKAVTYKNDSYWLFVWQDPTRSQKHLPLQKTEAGWRVLQTEFGKQDEDGFYEDKFAMMLSHSPEIAGAGTVHLGPQPLKNKPSAAGGRGLHYTDDGAIVDLWHWKSVRTGAIKQMDDNFFGPPKPAYQWERRYKGGYAVDPKAGGGYGMNWKYYYDDLVTPKRLPKPEYSPRLGEVDLDQLVSDDGIWAMNWLHTQPWSKENDNYHIGTIIPSVVVNEGMRGDRGDITAVGHWQDGQWTLEARRKINTDSKYDVAITNDVYIWVAVFDHSQTRHSYHLKPVRLKLP